MNKIDHLCNPPCQKMNLVQKKIFRIFGHKGPPCCAQKKFLQMGQNFTRVVPDTLEAISDNLEKKNFFRIFGQKGPPCCAQKVDMVRSG